jgi:hypothetical protein
MLTNLPLGAPTAACKSRQKKKEWIGNLERHAETLTSQNQEMQLVVAGLQAELRSLREQLASHRGCSCAGIQAYHQHVATTGMASFVPPPPANRSAPVTAGPAVSAAAGPNAGPVDPSNQYGLFLRNMARVPSMGPAARANSLTETSNRGRSFSLVDSLDSATPRESKTPSLTKDENSNPGAALASLHQNGAPARPSSAPPTTPAGEGMKANVNSYFESFLDGGSSDFLMAN